MKDLHKPHAALDEPAGDYELLGKSLGFVLFEAKRFVSGKRFGVEIDGFRHGSLHLKRELVTANAGGERGVVRVFDTSQSIELAEQCEFRGLLFTEDGFVRLSERQWIRGIGREL